MIAHSRTRVLVTLAAGPLRAREVRKRCAACGVSQPSVGSRQLARLAPPGQRYGYDLLVWVGLARYLRRLQRAEMRTELARQGIQLSDGSLTALCDRFLQALERLHWHCAPALRAARPLGYPLHIDATCEHGKGGTFVCLDGWTDWVLHAVKIASENESELRPAVDRTLAAFGQPLAIVRDLGSGGEQAVADYRQQGLPDLLCHYHFLAAVGHRLLDDSHASLRSQLTRSRLRKRLRELLKATRPSPAGQLPAGVREQLPALLLWLLEGSARKHPPYPFALPELDLYRRCGQFRAACQRRLPEPRTQREQHLLRQVSLAIADLKMLDPQGRLAARLECAESTFQRLRDVLRLTPEELPRGQRPGPTAGLSTQAAAQRLQAIAADLQRYHQQLREQASQGLLLADQPEAVVLSYLERYGEQLCGHPVVRDSAGRAQAFVARTNNVIEQFFAQSKQGLRRRLGRAHLGRDLEDQPAQAALVSNLRHPDYVQVVCGTLEKLPQAFAELEQLGVTDSHPLQRNNRDTALWRQIRAWAQDTDQHANSLSDPKCSQTHGSATES